MPENVVEKGKEVGLEEEKKSKLANIYKFRELGLLGFIIILSLVVQMRNSSFLSGENIVDLITNTAILSILALGMMLVLVTRGIDLSIGATIALSGMIVAQIVSSNQIMNPLLLILIGIIIGMLCGIINGFLIFNSIITIFF